ncbi:MAG TPA: SGNH/GDSL hydrolase family protein [Acidimicrobiales bacterium]|nr:SGNH/GDSL hydrolase family protein [Acidimicrobiales bacterium]
MPDARLPLRVLVKGSSTVVFVSWMGGPRADMAYPRVMEAEIRAAGVPVEVRVSALPAERIRTALRRWHREVLPWAPDVVVLHYGHADLIHLFLPRWLERHANTLGKRGGPVRSRYRRYVLRPVWIGLAKLQTAADRHLPRRLVTRRARKVVEDLDELIDRVRWVHRPLVLVPNLHPMGAQYRSWFPSIDLRMERMNELAASLVSRLDEPDIRVFDTRRHLLAVLSEGGDPVPDGSHFTAEVHRAVGRAMGREVVEWAREQDHLRLPADGS